MNNTINLDNFSFKAFTASLGLSKILPAVVTMAICLLAIWLLTKLTDYWFRSAGRNTGILLNIPPDTNGKIPEEDAAAVIQWNRMMKTLFAENLAREGKIDASGVLSEEYGPENLTDSREDALYAASEYCPEVTVSFPDKRRFDCFRLEEAIELGHRVRRPESPLTLLIIKLLISMNHAIKLV